MKTNKTILILILILTFVMSAGLFTACNGGETGEGNNNTEPEIIPPAAELPTITPAQAEFNYSYENGVFSFTGNYMPKQFDLKINGTYYDILARDLNLGVD